MPVLRRTALAVVLVLGLAAPAAAATASPEPRTAAQLQEQVARLDADLRARAAALHAAREEANTALEARQQAERAADLAEQQAASQAGALAAARLQVETAKAALDGFAGALYRTGPQQQGLSYLTAALLTSDAGALLHDVEVAEQVGDGRGQGYARFRAAEAAQRAATLRSQAAQARAVALRAAAGAAVRRAESAVAARALAVDLQAKELALAVDAAAVAQAREERLAAAERVALARSLVAVPAAALAGARAAWTGDCPGGDLAGHRNGELPVDALCPLWGAPGHALRADAAAAFDAMSRAYATEHATPLCVTDSYRSLPEQVAVREAKPHLAAVPGTSNHGWGVALDLCGGAERFDTPLHAWLVEHAAAYGWFLPAWAQADGPKPEPWHWEFAGR